jgi:hypothetical protein
MCLWRKNRTERKGKMEVRRKTTKRKYEANTGEFLFMNFHERDNSYLGTLQGLINEDFQFIYIYSFIS